MTKRSRQRKARRDRFWKAAHDDIVQQDQEWSERKQRLEELENISLAKLIFIKKLNFRTTQEQLKSFLEATFPTLVGQVEHIVFPDVAHRSRRPGDANSGQAIVDFRDAVHASTVLQAWDGEVRADIGSGRFRTIIVSRVPRSRARSCQQRDSLTFSVDSLYIGGLIQVADGLELCSEWSTHDGKMKLDLSSRALVLEFAMGGRTYKLESRFKHIVGHLIQLKDHALLIQLSVPPRVYWKPGEDQSDGASFGGLLGILLDVIGEMKWKRTTDFTPHGTIGACLTYVVKLSSSIHDQKLISKLQDFHLLPRHNMVTHSIYVRHLGGEEDVEDLKRKVEVGLQQLPFRVRYQLLVLLSLHGAVSRWQLKDGRVFQILSRHRHREAACVKALEDLCSRREQITNLEDRIASLLDDGGSSDDEDGSPFAALPPHLPISFDCRHIPRLLVTPTRVRVLPLEDEMSNRVLREFTNIATAPKHIGVLTATHFARVTVGEESGERLYGLGEENDSVWARAKSVIEQGITVLGRTYVFLAYSSSQLKECSVWMVSGSLPGSYRTGAEASIELADRMRASLGDFMATIRIPAKCAARMGQCFSTTAETIKIAASEEVMISDVERNGYCFSDGCGELSPALLADVMGRVPFGGVRRQDITAVQVRYGGCKGVLSLNPALPGRLLCIRPSMQKFDSHHRSLEVCSVAGWVPCYLNRQVIILLVSNGVPEEIFLQRQALMLTELDNMLGSREAAAGILPRLGGVEGGLMDMLLRMLESGISPRCDLFLHRCLVAVREHHLMELKRKCRILVQQGAVVIGSMDETEELPEDCVFVQVQLDRACLDCQWTVITGPVLVAKHPVMHPGDVRVYTAVDVPSLRVHKNEIKFPRWGSRPIPNQLSGSDLDGDQYAVVWDQELLLPYGNAEAMDYTAEKPIPIDGPMEVHHLVEHFINHARNDNLGAICNAWLVHADERANGGSPHGCAGGDQCLKLAKLGSIAVDFPKTGIPAQMTRELQPNRYPHWMGKKDKSEYTSSSVLGKLYDAIMERHGSVDSRKSRRDLEWEDLPERGAARLLRQQQRQQEQWQRLRQQERQQERQRRQQQQEWQRQHDYGQQQHAQQQQQEPGNHLQYEQQQQQQQQPLLQEHDQQLQEQQHEQQDSLQVVAGASNNEDLTSYQQLKAFCRSALRSGFGRWLTGGGGSDSGEPANMTTAQLAPTPARVAMPAAPTSAPAQAYVAAPAAPAAAQAPMPVLAPTPASSTPASSVAAWAAAAGAAAVPAAAAPSPLGYVRQGAGSSSMEYGSYAGSTCQAGTSSADPGWPLDLVVPGWESWHEAASAELELYSRDLVERVMNRYHIYREGEVLTGCILKYNKYQKRKQHDVKEQLNREVRGLCSHYRRRFLQAVLRGLDAPPPPANSTMAALLREIEQHGDAGRLALQRMACACYRATYFGSDDGSDVGSEGEDDAHAPAIATVVTQDGQPSWPKRDATPLYSYPWVVAAEELGALCSRHMGLGAHA